MKQQNFKDSDLYKMGHEGELLVKDMLQKQGWYIIPSYDYTNGDKEAPKMHGLSKSFVIPDLDISRSGKRLWAEVKTKTKPTFTRKTQQYEHGFPLRHYTHYLKVQEISGCEVWIYLYEILTGLVLRKNIRELSTRIYNGNKMDRGGTVFFPRRDFEIIGFYTGKDIMPYPIYVDIAKDVSAKDTKKYPSPVEANFVDIDGLSSDSICKIIYSIREQLCEFLKGE